MLAAISTFLTLVLSLLFKCKPVQMQEGEALGSATQKVADLQKQVKTEAAIVSAEANAPSTVAGVEDMLKDGTF